MVRKEKILGGLLGGGIGDALGAPVEGFNPCQIKEIHPGGLNRYVNATFHKHFNPEDLPPGTVTDDTDTTVATMRAVINAKWWDMDAMAATHIKCLENSTLGFGKSTLESLQRLRDGVCWSKSGQTKEKKRGFGNGIPMKCFALAAILSLRPQRQPAGFNQFMVKFAAMTHWTKMAAISGIIHVHALRMCLELEPDEFDVEKFLYFVSHDPFEWVDYGFGGLDDSEDDLQKPLLDLWNNRKDLPYWSIDEIRQRFGNGSFYVYNTLPFCYALFCQNPYSFDTGRIVAEAGGDTDTNAKIVLEMIGSLNGLSIIQQDENRWSLDGLLCHDELFALGEEFCNTFNIK